MAELVIINARRKNQAENAYIGTIGQDGYIYFNDDMFYRFKTEGNWEQNLYVLNRWRHSWTRCQIFEKLSAVNLNNGGGSTAPGGSGVEGAVQWAISIADDPSHGYDQPTRDGGVDFDCSSLVSWAFRENGFEVPWPSPSTYTMRSIFQGLGFQWIPGNPSADQLVRGRRRSTVPARRSARPVLPDAKRRYRSQRDLLSSESDCLISSIKVNTSACMFFLSIG